MFRRTPIAKGISGPMDMIWHHTFARGYIRACLMFVPCLFTTWVIYPSIDAAFIEANQGHTQTDIYYRVKAKVDQMNAEEAE